MSYGHVNVETGKTYSNELEARFLEYRKVTSQNDGIVRYEIVFGKRKGSTGVGTVRGFWKWRRGVVVGEVVDNIEP